ncbi:MAG TPA: hypothetical protein ENK88_02810, partial [Campylobacterales bacterium]|nr:hypothetical protein [Campylobacterales bacterium]
MQSYANTQYISPLTTLVIEKKLRGENTDALEDMVKDFDPVIAGTTILSKTGEEKNKIQKLIILMETVKNAKRQSYPIGNIDVSSIINTNISDTIDSFNINTLSNGFPTNVQTKTDIMKRIMTLIDDLDTNHLNINSFLINISDAGKNIKDSIKSSFIGTLPSDDNELYQAIIKSSSDVSAISYELDSLNNSIELLKIPTANAGFDRNITEGKPSIFDASGSVDFDGSIVSYEWREGNSVLSTNISFTKNDFSLGEHNITLTVVDDINNSDSDLLTIMVLPNKPPVANAGADKIAMVGDSVLFDAGLSSDSDGNIISYQWEDNGTILSHSVTFSTTNLPQGTHHILLTVVDDSNASSQDEVVVTISERQRTNKKSVDGYIIKIPSPAIALCSNGQSYQSSLTVGAKGAILFDRVELTDDCIITVPIGTTIDSNNNAQLDVSDKVINFEMKAPAYAKFISPLTTLLLEKEARGEDVTEFKAMVKDFDPVEGVSDILSKTGAEKLKIQKLLVMMEVLKTAMKNSSPIVDINISSLINTENNETIDDFNINQLISTLPSDIKNLVKTKADTIKRLTKVIQDINGSKIDIDSFIVNVSDGGQNISSSLKNSIKPDIEVNQSNLIEDVSKSEIVSELNNLNYISNNIPIAVAGADQNVREQTTVTLNASQSSDIDNDIVSYEWKDNNSVLSNQRVFSENNFSIGTHNITLTVMDELNASSSDNLTITVNPNQLPTVDAGSDFAMQVNDTITLSASATDSDGNIVSYEWKKENTILSNSRVFSYTPTAVGNDILSVTVTDDLGAIASDEINITVHEIPNIAPVVDAGSDKTIHVNESLRITGSATDDDGHIVSYQWKKGN